MPYAASIRRKLESDGWMVSEIGAGGRFSVTATKGGKSHVGVAENKTVAYLEIERSIRNVQQASQR